MTLPEPINVVNWVEQNKSHFMPPVCNKMLHSQGQLKLFYVGGPNQRKDYHIEEGEELFYMTKGDMELKMLVGNQFVHQPIKEGQLFLLPANVFHSPQRTEGTVGWVIERERPTTDMDGLRYFVESSTGQPTLRPLFERYVHMEDLGSQIAEIIAEFHQSEEFCTQRPSGDGNASTPPVAYKPEVRPPPPVTLTDWLDDHRDELDAADGTSSVVDVFPGGGRQFLVEVVGRSNGKRRFLECGCETWLLQLAGESIVFVEDVEGAVAASRRLGPDDSLLVPAGVAFCVSQEAGCRLLKASQDRNRKAY